MKELNEIEEQQVTGGRKRDNYDFSTLEALENSPIFEQLKNEIKNIKYSVNFTELNTSRIFEITRKLKIIIKENGYTVYENAAIQFTKKYWDLV